ncbi:GtrA family protein [Amycolatopsis benzoatilytica]|uniref:GtrA family protein n=1 Tax=Amycolatopsis benzoatilytica TaxID=346045 RepID=UPI0003609FB4|nr:GtrA family protein [Amycolatopsis benzoatilytica]
MVATEPQSDQTQPGTAGPGLLGQLVRFGVIGGFCALLDLGTYSLLRAVGMDAAPWVDLARAISFIVGTTTAFFLNRRFTFAAGKREGNAQVGSFVLLYAVTFFVAVGVNQVMLRVLPESGWQATLAWVVSQATATVINFVMLKWVVFRVRPVKEN